MLFNYTPPKYLCPTCGEYKTECEFGKQSMTGIRTSQCTQCINIKRSVVRNKARHGKFISKEKQRAMETPDFSLEQWKETMLYFRGACAFCGKPEGRARADKMDRDHLVPLSKGGKTVMGNIIPACRKCNRGRGNKNWIDWFMEQSFYDTAKAQKIYEWKKRYNDGR